MSLFTEAIGLMVCWERLCQTCTSPSHFFVRLSGRFLTLSLSTLCPSLFLTHTRRQGMFRLNRLQQSVIHFLIPSSLCSVFPLSISWKKNFCKSPLLFTDSPTLIAPEHSWMNPTIGRISAHAPVLRQWHAGYSITHGRRVSSRAAGGHVSHVTTC